MAREPDRYLAATLAHRDFASGLAAIAAFSAELARVPATVSEPMLGSIKLQWWRDALAAARQGTPSGHPVIDALAATLGHHDVDMAAAEAMIEAREMDLAGTFPTDDASLAAYLDAIEGNAFRLSLAVAGARGAEADAAARNAGRAYGLARIPGRLLMPASNGGLPMSAECLRLEEAESGKPAAAPGPFETTSAVTDVAAGLRQWARNAHNEAIALRRALPKRARVVLLPLAMVEPYFRDQSPASRLDRMTEVSDLARVVRIGWAHFTGRI